MDNTDIVLNHNTATYTMAPTQGVVLGTYQGTFEFRCYLSPLQQLEAGREYRALLGNLSSQASETEGTLAFALAQLKFRVVRSPPFWTAPLQEGSYAGNIPDLNIIALVLDRAIRAESLFKERLQKERDAILDRSIQVAEEMIPKE